LVLEPAQTAALRAYAEKSFEREDGTVVIDIAIMFYETKQRPPKKSGHNKKYTAHTEPYSMVFQTIKRMVKPAMLEHYATELS
jgi:hypothetical protein